MVDKTSSKDLKLPSMPDTVRECLAQMYSLEADLNKMANLIQKDPGITASVLKLANSSIYGVGKSTSDLKVGITRIGMTSLMQILVKYSVENLFKFDSFDFFNIKAFTKHGAWVSQVAFELGKVVKTAQITDLLVAGLFHDIGLLVRAISDKVLMKKITETCVSEKIDFNSAEKKLKLDGHEVLGADLLKNWQFPDGVILLVKNHHTEEAFRSKNLTSEQNNCISVLCLSDTIAHRFGNAYLNYYRDTRVNSVDLDKLGISNQEVSSAVKLATQHLQHY
ncbi:HDOD domain-containing protein [Fluviispira multicolorata]|uniref:HDOD domain-containing protein n=1 Tax=Fluviispira multicolorata TaxID=2654512 RepID=A0A833JE34_9BACT|nr:HDOD domain-containing protein [Fluviispira multicolorata]KAB8032210.1 HDOD domain-containing protein [Fluviispira multicolorata]